MRQHPNQVVEPALMGKVIVHRAPQFDELLACTFAIPEPIAIALMHRSPQDRHFGIAELCEPYGYALQICPHSLILG